MKSPEYTRGLAYYNEIDPFAAAWLRALIADGHIAPGEVDERSIVDVRAADLVGYRQCHFFAGIGVWSAALRGAGWPDHQRVWTGSCPCQPFSSAGAQAGFSDARHLWPEFARLITECRPPVVLGEQVASPLGRAWLDAVCADLEGLDYACGAADLCAASVGAPHIRQRLYWVADDANSRREGGAGLRRGGSRERGRSEPANRSDPHGMGHASVARLEGHGRSLEERHSEGREGAQRHRSENGSDDRMGNPSRRCGSHWLENDGRSAIDGVAIIGTGSGNGVRRDPARVLESLGSDVTEARRDDAVTEPGPTNGLWGATDWLLCTDGKWRPVEPESFPLAHGAPARVGRLRGYGNAIVAEVATAFIEAYLSARDDLESIGTVP